MDSDHSSGRRRLPGYDDWAAADARSQKARVGRDEGVRRVRRMSNWTAAALVAGVAATSGYFAHAATVAAPSPAPGYSGPASTGGQGATHSGHKPSVTHPVVTSGGSGVTAGSGGASGAGSGGAGSGGAGSGGRDN